VRVLTHAEEQGVLMVTSLEASVREDDTWLRRGGSWAVSELGLMHDASSSPGVTPLSRDAFLMISCMRS
jgi:hypothetical protein